MSPSKEKKEVGMTEGQIEKIVQKLRVALKKHCKEFETDAAQKATTAKGLDRSLLGVVRGYVERFSKMVVRIVWVIRTRTPSEAIAATKRREYIDKTVLEEMPKGRGTRTKVIFFQVGRLISDDDLEKEYTLRGLLPADPYSLAAVNEADPAFADDRPNATYWKNKEGKLCYAAFRRSGGERGVEVSRNVSVWFGGWWFAGLAS